MHQANLRINEAVQKSLGLPDERVFNNIQKYGNTTAATLPLVFHEAKLAGRVNRAISSVSRRSAPGFTGCRTRQNLEKRYRRPSTRIRSERMRW